MPVPWWLWPKTGRLSLSAFTVTAEKSTKSCKPTLSLFLVRLWVCYFMKWFDYRSIPTNGTLQLYIDTHACKGTDNQVDYLEHVQAVITLNSTRRGEIVMHLGSPMGTRWDYGRCSMLVHQENVTVTTTWSGTLGRLKLRKCSGRAVVDSVPHTFTKQTAAEKVTGSLPFQSVTQAGSAKWTVPCGRYSNIMTTRKAPYKTDSRH